MVALAAPDAGLGVTSSEQDHVQPSCPGCRSQESTKGRPHVAIIHTPIRAFRANAFAERFRRHAAARVSRPHPRIGTSPPRIGPTHLCGSVRRRMRRKVAVGEFPSWSPDSLRLAYIKGTTVHGSAVYVVDVIGGAPHRVPGTEGASGVAWSPDGSRLAFSRWKDPLGGAILVVPATGGTAVRINPPNAPARSPTWSPDGMWIAYVRVTNRHAQIAATSLDSSDTEPLTPRNADYFNPSWTVP